jgi:20S proteasome subunit beta 6
MFDSLLQPQAQQQQQQPIQHQFSPFSDNGGYASSSESITSIIVHPCSTTVAIAGEDFCLVAADTRQSDGYEINSRYQPHTYKVQVILHDLMKLT